MSIVMKGFDKPEDCYTCPFNHSDWYCSLTKGSIDRDNWDCSVVCPIKELPKGHGRIYDENELRKWIIEGDEVGCGYIDERDIIDIPAIIEADKERE